MTNYSVKYNVNKRLIDRYIEILFYQVIEILDTDIRINIVVLGLYVYTGSNYL